MNTRIVLVVLLAIIVVGGAWYAFVHHNESPMPIQTAATSETDTGTASTSETEDASSNTGVDVSASVTTPAHKTVTVIYTDQGFSPNSTSIAIGDTVKFVNQSSHGMWVASDAHPTHTEYDGTSLAQHCSGGADIKGGFDECTAIQNGQSYSFTFPKSGTFEYHNHVQASDTGTVIVK